MVTIIGLELTVIASAMIVPLAGKASVTFISVSEPEKGSVTIVPLARRISVSIVPDDAVVAGPLPVDVKIDVIDGG